ncbi:MAG: CDP-alcohol phosphatidyltransferase family protein [Flavobacteriales bacterium]
MARLPRIPDLLTTANLACGVASILLASQGQLTIACGLVFVAAFFDVLDGLAARALGGGSPMGAQLDSLADMVSFGVAPMFIILNIPPDWFVSFSDYRAYTPIDWYGLPIEHYRLPDILVVGSFLSLIPICSAWRLAKFNVDTRQSSGFLGLPTPANALFWCSIPLICSGTAVLSGPGADSIRMFIFHLLGRWLLFPIIFWIPLVLGLLMLSEIPLPSLKFKHFNWKGNEVIFLLMGIGLVLVVLYGILAIPLILILYLLSPLWGRLFGGNAAASQEP